MYWEKVNKFDELVGKTVTGLATSGDQSQLVLTTTDGPVLIETYADCCSETWFADIVGYDALIGSPILTAESIDLPQPEDNRTRQEEDQAYGIKFTTANGTCDIAYRNSSNGYYGGYAYIDSKPDNVLPDLTPITGDWSA